MGDSGPEWGGERAQLVLELVLRWCGARELATAGGVCRAWWRAARQPHVWRRALATSHALGEPLLRAMAPGAWRRELLLSVGGWRRAGPPLRPSPGTTVAHAALAPRDTLLAIATDDASVSVWQRDAAGRWEARGVCSLRACGWAACARVQWDGGGRRLLAVGPLALSPRWELAVLRARAGAVSLQARAAASAPGAACWLPGGALVALELRRAAPHLATTTVWLYSADQQAQSEHAGVAAPLLRLYNEGRAPYTWHVLAAALPAPLHDPPAAAADTAAAAARDTLSEYYRIINSDTVKDTEHIGEFLTMLVVAGGAPEGAQGRATALGVWALGPGALQPPPLRCEGGDLGARRRARQRAAPPPPAEEAPPSEDELRALCAPPRARTDLGARVLGLTLQPHGRCVWAVLDDHRVLCVSLPALRVLRALGGRGAGGGGPLYYLQPAASERLVASPQADGSVSVWCTRSGAVCVPPGGAGAAGAPVLGALLTQGGHRLLMLKGDVVQEWASRAPTPAHTTADDSDSDSAASSD